MPRTLAHIVDGAVTEFISVADHMAALPYRREWLDVTDLVPAPQLGWVWDGTALQAARPVNLGVLRADRLSALRSACAAAIGGGFSSSALGTTHAYPSSETDQRNLADAATAATATPSGWTAGLWCEARGAWTLAPHTAPQIAAVFGDWVAFRMAQQQRLVTLGTALAAATDQPGIAAVNW